MTSFIRKTVASAATAILGLLAMTGASAQIVATGGSTLAHPAYSQIFQFGPISGFWLYSAVGSNAGKSAFLQNNAAPLGLSGSVHAVATEMPLTAAELSAYNASGLATTLGPVLQIPAFIAPTLLAYNEPGIVTLNLSTGELCRIFSFDASARRWDQVTTAADDGGIGSASAIQVVFPQPGDTIERLSRFLSAACAPHLPAGKTFTVSNDPRIVVQSALPVLSAADDANGDGMPDVWLTAAGSAGVRTALQTAHRLGIQSPDPMLTSGGNAEVARVDGFLPTVAGLQAALPAPPASTLQRANPLNWAPAYAVPVGAYPIYGVSQLLIGRCYLAGTNGAGTPGYAVKEFVTNIQNGAFDATFVQRGLAPLTSAWKTAMLQNFLAMNAPQEIGHLSACAGIGR